MRKIMTIAALFFSLSSYSADLTLFTDRPADRYEKALAAFTQKSGLKVAVVTAPYGELKSKLAAGEKADLLVLKDMSTFTEAAREGLYQPMSGANRLANVDPAMKDENGLWIALAYRVRTVVYDPSAVNPADVDTYVALSNPVFKGAICMRNAKEYIPTLAAWLIARHGEQRAESILSGWKTNLANGFLNGDTDVLKAVESGQCVASVTNHYYFARLKAADERFGAEILFADQATDGAHTSGYAAGIPKTSASVDKANQLLSYLLSVEGQSLLIAEPSFEYPASRDAQPLPLVQAFGNFKGSQVHWNKIGVNSGKAKEVLERVQWSM